jgi:hypothetical protein
MIIISPILLAVFLIALIYFIAGWGFYGGIVIGLNYVVGGCLGTILWFIFPESWFGSTFVGTLAGTVAGTVYGITLDGYLAGCIIGFVLCLHPALIVCLCLYEFVLLPVYEFVLRHLLWCAAAAAAAASLQRLTSQGKFHLKPKIVTLPSPRLCDDFGQGFDDDEVGSLHEQLILYSCADANHAETDTWLHLDREAWVRENKWFLTTLGNDKFFEAFAALPPQPPELRTGRWWESGQSEIPFAAERVDPWGEWLSRAATLPLPYGFKIAPRDDATLHFCESTAAGMLHADWFILSDGSLQGCTHYNPWHDPGQMFDYESTYGSMLLLLRAPLESLGECGRLVARDDDPNLTENQIYEYGQKIWRWRAHEQQVKP